ncbi:2-oxoglutarate translocator, partial [Clostridioides difficile]|nr:2-oxoglutarate translocator [Clostridioides difficile]
MKIFIDTGSMWRCSMRNNKSKVLLGILCLATGMAV